MMMAVVIGGIVGIMVGFMLGILGFAVMLSMILSPAEKADLIMKIKNITGKGS